jgi:WD40 repeat protein
VLSKVIDTLTQSGPAAAEAVLDGVDGPAAAALRRVLAADAHLLEPAGPGPSPADVLIGRLAGIPQLRGELAAVAAAPRLVDRSPVPETHHPALLRSVRVGDGIITALAVAPDGTWLATGGRDGVVRLWEVATGRPLAQLTGHDLEVRAIAIAPDGSWLAAAGFTAAVHVWDPATGAPLATLTGHTNLVYDLAVAPDGSWLAVPFPGEVWIWNTATWTRTEIVAVPFAGTAAVAPDGSWLAVHGTDGRVRIVDTHSWQERQSLYYDRKYGTVTPAPDGTWLATSGGDDIVRIWDLGTGKARASLEGGAGTVGGVAVARDGGWLAVGDESTVWFWDPVRDEIVAGLGSLVRVHRLVVAPDERWFATLHADAVVRIWDLAAVLAAGWPEPPVRVWNVVPVPGGVWRSVLDGETLLMSDALTGEPRWKPAAEPDPLWKIRHRFTVNPVQTLSPDGAWLISADETGRPMVLDAVTGRRRHRYVGHGNRQVRAVAYKPDGDWVASACDQELRLWNPANGRDRLVAKVDYTQVNGLAIAPDGDWLAVGSSDGRVRLKDTGTGKNRKVLRGHTGMVMAVAIAPDGTWLASAGTDATVRIWDATTGRQRAELHGHSGTVETLAITPDGTRLASGGEGGIVRIWDVAAAAPLAGTRVDRPTVRRCHWLPDGVTLCVWGGGEPQFFEFQG